MKTDDTSTPGETMNVREVHGAILREWKLPGEKKRRVPWYLHLLYFALALWGLLYFLTYFADFDWNEYEHRPAERIRREYREQQDAARRTEQHPQPADTARP
jgi:hypothetical protein